MRSVAGSDYEDYELLVLDDASTDDSAGAVQRFMRDHDWLPASLLRHTANEGLAGTRNTLTAHARGELVFVLDADNGVYPQALGRLVAALDADPGAAFAYPMIAAHDDRGPVWVLSRFGWDPELLVEDNFVDAMALIRRRALVDVGGYCGDPRLGGWEDYDLWCQFAERGWRGVQVPELLAWYRRSGHSMLSTSASDFVEARSVIAARAPEVFVGGTV
jgi:glycosyltransferase involved in cell wall biosynthesis